jgi:hypothetical protein
VSGGGDRGGLADAARAERELVLVILVILRWEEERSVGK